MKRLFLTTTALLISTVLLTGCNTTNPASTGKEQIDKTKEVVKQIEDRNDLLPDQQ